MKQLHQERSKDSWMEVIQRWASHIKSNVMVEAWEKCDCIITSLLTIQNPELHKVSTALGVMLKVPLAPSNFCQPSLMNRASVVPASDFLKLLSPLPTLPWSFHFSGSLLILSHASTLPAYPMGPLPTQFSGSQPVPYSSSQGQLKSS